eukprot:TRINITY_DN3501_c0_g1_i2.p2 TRINITY_DN3501_c0_g1~~TRINITY_DN3501_c0_g1_i2.p2  ORF type:complete len:110 (-),score=17.51 TRINITY_DN3501_c0_g1_i2:25-354(-)
MSLWRGGGAHQRAKRLVRLWPTVRGGGGHEVHGPAYPSMLDPTKPYGGFEPPHVAPAHRILATALGTTMWLWVFWRIKHDGAAMLRSGTSDLPWEHHGHGHDDHNDGLK